MDTSLLDRAIIFAVRAHQGMERRGKDLPYIVHPMEAVSILATMTNDQEMLAAAALHDVVEDTPTTIDELRREFGDRVAKLVESESEEDIQGLSRTESWKQRKQAAINRLANAPRDSKMVALGDKLSNMRTIAADYAQLGDKLWDRFSVKDRSLHAWHYQGLADALADLKDYAAYNEFNLLVTQIFQTI